MSTRVREWSFARRYDVGDGPWPSEDEATVTYDSDTEKVVVSGVFFDGDTRWEGCVRQVAYVPAENALRVDVGVVRTGQRFGQAVAQRIHYEVRVEFFGQLPERTTVRHVDENEETQFSTTVTRANS
ncbi:MAG: hypothetical protein ABEJ04_06090 [Halobacteriaceae archaeon]